jgi:carboxypeptidase D
VNGAVTAPPDQLGLKFDFLDIPYTVNPISDNLHPHHWMNRTSAVAFNVPESQVLIVHLARQHHPRGASRPAQQDLACYDDDLSVGERSRWDGSQPAVSSSHTFSIRSGIQNFRRSTFFMDELAANATKENVGIVWYSGNDDALTTHWSTEVVIQVRLLFHTRVSHA